MNTVPETAGTATGGWQRRYTIVTLCVLAVFVCYIDRVNISVAVIAMQEHFGWDEKTKGLVLSSFFIGYMLFMAPSGWLANKLGGKLILGGAVLWWSLFTILTPAAAALGLPLLIITRIAMGMGESAMFPSAYNLYGRWVPPAERSRAVSMLIGGIPLGTLFALMTTGWIVQQWGWQSVFYIFGVVGVAWSLLWYVLAHDNPAHDPRCSAAERDMLAAHAPPPQASPAVPWKTLFTTPAIWALIVNHFCSNWVLYMLLAWLPSYFKQAQGLNIMQAGIYSAAPWLSMFIIGNLAGVIADKLTQGGMDLTRVRKLMQCTGLVGSALCLLAVQDVSEPMTALVLMCGALGLAAFTWSGFVPNHLDIAPRYADVLMGITNTAGTIPGIIGVYITGWLVDATGTYSAAFVLCASVNIFGAVVWALFATAKRVVD
ncbi:MAG: ACS family MFS transporter [Gammaproteobacteria bacterium]|nr:ACS family MFS transporter [Gammaproteobacteria bacterium]